MPFDSYMEAILFVLGTPNCNWEFIRRLVAASATGVAPPAGSLPAALIA